MKEVRKDGRTEAKQKASAKKGNKEGRKEAQNKHEIRWRKQACKNQIVHLKSLVTSLVIFLFFTEEGE